MRQWLLGVWKIGIVSSFVYLVLIALVVVFHEQFFSFLGDHGYYFLGDMD